MTQPVVALERPTWSLTMTGVDGGAGESLDDDVEVGLEGSGGITHRDPPVDKAGELLLQALDDLAQTFQLLDLDLTGLLVDVDHLQFASVVVLPHLALLEEFHLVGLGDVSGDVPELGVLADLVGGAGADGLSVNVDIRLLAQVEPDDGTVLGVLVTAPLVQRILEALDGGLAAAVDLEPGL